MRIGIDARMMGKGYGLGRYVEELIQALEQGNDQEHEYVIFLRKENFDSFESVKKNWHKVLADIPWYTFSEQYHLLKIIKKEKVDLMHFPHFNVPILYNKPFIVTIHDLTMFHYPRPEATTHGPLVYWFKDQIHRKVIKHAVIAAQHIITVSDYVKFDLHQTLGVPLQKMTTIYQAPVHSRLVEKELNLAELGITKPYVLYVGAAYPHKNLEKLIEAWDLVQQSLGGKYQLVLAGKDNYFYKKIKKEAEEKIKGKKSSVVFPGFISDMQLPLLYKNAVLFVFPSLSEGFGFPPLEAMSHNVPVVASNRTSLPEVLGEAAYFVDPESSEHIASGIITVLEDKDLQIQLVQNGKKEISKYSWERLGRETLQLYKTHQ